MADTNIKKAKMTDANTKKATMAEANITGYIIYVQSRYFRITVEFSWQRDNGKISTISLGQSK